MDNKDTYITVRMSANNKGRLEKLAFKKRITVSQLVRNFILDILDKVKIK
jgi:hypothetical protein